MMVRRMVVRRAKSRPRIVPAATLPAAAATAWVQRQPGCDQANQPALMLLLLLDVWWWRHHHVAYLPARLFAAPGQHRQQSPLQPP